MKKIMLLLAMLAGFAGQLAAQGPPILIDKPIMLGAKKGTVRLLAQMGDYHHTDFSALTVMVDYNLRNDLAVALLTPLTLQNSELSIGDLTLEGKYQFFRKDGMGKTFRMAAKGAYTLPTGDDSAETMLVGLGEPNVFAGILAGYESLGLGVVTELGYLWAGGDLDDNLSYKLTFGLPIFEPSYPVKQVTAYAEFYGISAVEGGESSLHLAPGLQYAVGMFTFDAAYQFPIYQHGIPLHHVNKHTYYLGWRVAF